MHTISEQNGGGANGSHRQNNRNVEYNQKEFPKLYLAFTANRDQAQLTVWLLRGQSTGHAASRLQAGLNPKEEYQFTIHLREDVVLAFRQFLESDPGEEVGGFALIDT